MSFLLRQPENGQRASAAEGVMMIMMRIVVMMAIMMILMRTIM